MRIYFNSNNMLYLGCINFLKPVMCLTVFGVSLTHTYSGVLGELYTFLLTYLTSLIFLLTILQIL